MNPPGSKRLPASPDEWLTHALSDLKLGKLGQKNKGILRQQVCFHAQQAAEKAFKAVLLYRTGKGSGLNNQQGLENAVE